MKAACRHGWTLLALVLALPMAAQPPGMPQARILPMTAVAGQNLQAVYSFTEDENGFLWFGGLPGLFKFDGSNLQLLANDPGDPNSITFGRLSVIVNDPKGPLWVGTDKGGLSLLDKRSGRARSFFCDLDNQNTIGGNYVAAIHLDSSGNVWVGTDNYTLNFLAAGSSKFLRFHPPLPPGANTYVEAGLLGDIIADVKNPDVLWIGSRTGVYRFSKGTHSWDYFPFPQPVEFWYSQGAIHLLMDPDGTLWAGGYETGLFRLDRKSWTWSTLRFSPDSGRGKNIVNQISSYDDNWLWISAGLEGLVWVNRHDRRVFIQKLVQPNNPTANWLVHGACKTQAKEWWIYGSNGVMRWNEQPKLFPYYYFQHANPRALANNWQRSYALSPDKKRLFIGTLRGDGLLIWDWAADTLGIVPYRPGEADAYMDDLCFDLQGRLWIGSSEGLMFWDGPGKPVRPFRAGFPAGQRLEGSHVSALAVSGEELWIGTQGSGLFRMNLVTGKTYAWGEKAGLNDNSRINKILVDHNGRVWIGHDQGLTTLLPTRGEMYFFGRRDEIRQGLSYPYVSDIEMDRKGRLWIATIGGGLNVLDPRTWTFRFFSNRDIVGGNMIYEMAILRSGQIWLGMQSGLSMFDPEREYYINYTYEDGLFAKIGALAALPDGRIVSGGNYGFHLFSPHLLLRRDPPPRPYLRRFRVLNEDWPLDSTGPQPRVSLAYGQRQFSVDIGALDVSENARNVFSYRLEGNDEKWTFAGARRYIAYTNLPAGKYKLWVKAANKHLIWSEPVPLLDIYIKPPYWLQPWFLFLSGLALACLVFIIYRARQTRLQLLEASRIAKAEAEQSIREKERQLLELDKHLAEAQLVALRAQMNPHFLFNCLNSINWYIIKNKPREASRYLTKFSRLVRMILDHSKTQQILLSQEIEALRLYLDLEAMRFERKFDYEIEVDENLDVDEIEIAPLILQPYVENAIWHGLMPGENPGWLRIHIFPQNGHLNCVIEDNGIGREAAEQSRRGSIVHRESKGLKITADRISMLNHQKKNDSLVQIIDKFDESGKPAGTRVELQLPLL